MRASALRHRQARAIAVWAVMGATAFGAWAEPRKPGTSPKPGSGDAGFAPDPPVAASTRLFRYPIQVSDGTISVQRPSLILHERAVATPRRFGRFALELYVGRELLERVRFDIPLLDEAPKKKLHAGAPDFTRHLGVRVFAELPDLDRATYAVLVDRATGSKQRIFWPPVDDFLPATPVSARSASPVPPASVSASARPLPPHAASSR